MKNFFENVFDWLIVAITLVAFVVVSLIGYWKIGIIVLALLFVIAVISDGNNDRYA